MMDFLRRLAPPREGDRSRAAGVLPARFASDAYRLAVSTRGDAPSIFDDAPALPDERTTTSHGPTAASEPPLPRRAQRTPVGPASAGGPPVASAPVATLQGLPHESTPLVRPRRGAADVDVPVPSWRRDVGSAFNELPVMQAQTMAIAAARPVSRPRTSPLSPNAVAAARASPGEPPRPVIHITIDRIDVRAPAAPPRAAESAKPRAAAPSLSLADYLQGNASPRRGGVG